MLNLRRRFATENPSRGQAFLEGAWLAAFGAALGWAIIGRLGGKLPAASWSRVVLMGGALGLVLWCMARAWPAQVVISLGLGCMGLSAALEILAVAIEVTVFSAPSRSPWPGGVIPLVSAIVLLLSRSSAQVLLWSWRRAATYGYWLTGGSAVLTTVMELALYSDPLLGLSSSGARWLMVPWVRLLANSIIYLALTPWFVKTRPSSTAPSLKPLFVWTALYGLAVFPW